MAEESQDDSSNTTPRESAGKEEEHADGGEVIDGQQSVQQPEGKGEMEMSKPNDASTDSKQEPAEKDDEIEDKADGNEGGKRQRKSKSFTGCYTCRRRKIACDLGRPSCLKCKKSGFLCEGYDVKLRWSQPIEFDKCGYQLPSKPNQETEYCQRRSIEYVRYSDKTAYKYYDEMDTDLARLHNRHMESKALDTVIRGHFGVFRGTRLKPKKKRRRGTESSFRAADAKRKKTGECTPSASPATLSGGGTNGGSSSLKTPVLKPTSHTSINTLCSSSTPQYKPLKKTQSFMYPQNMSSSIVSNQAQFDANNKGNPMGNEWLSTELLDAALLTASALNGDTHFLDMFDLDNSNALPSFSTVSANNHATEQSSHGNNTVGNTGNGSGVKNNNAQQNVSNSAIDHRASTDFFSDSVPDKMLHLLFQGRNAMDVSESSQQQQKQQQEQLHGPSSGPKNVDSQFPTQQQQQQQQQQSFADRRFQIQSLSQSNETQNRIAVHNDSDFSQSQQYPQLNPSDLPKNSQQSTDSSYVSSMSMIAKSRYPPVPVNEVVSINSADGSAIASSSLDQAATPSSSGVAQNAGIAPTTNLNNNFKVVNQLVVENEINIHASSGIKMPKTIMEILETTPLPKSLAIDKFGIPTTSLNVHPMARYLLNYYIEDVADMMTVIPLAKNPWKFIYFPRALMAVGELASLGRTSNARNGLLNALLAVSAFNLQSKFVRGSDEMKYYVDLGIQLRRQANEFVNRCMEEDILSQKYKDVLVAVLSMVTIDVVWGTMSSCKIHLDHCEKIIEKKMLHKKKLSSKAIILHRIFSSLKLIQDSTSLENIQKSEIFLNEKNYKNFLTGSKPTKEQLDELNKDNFRGIFRGSRIKSNRNNAAVDSGLTPNDNGDESSYTNGLSTRASSNRPELENTSGLSPGSLNLSRQRNGKRGKYNEKITDNGKVRIEFIVNNEESSLNNDQFDASSDIPAFVDITRTSFKPSKNKLEDKVVSSDAIYGLPNSLILMFGEIVPLTRFKKYHEDHSIPLPSFFDELATQLEFKLLTWKLEWTLIVEDENGSSIEGSIDEDKRTFISPRHEGIYHHVMSFYHALIIYFYRFIEDVNPMYLLERIEKVLHHLNKIQDILENNKETSYIIPLFWQGFIAGSEAMTLYLQNGFNKWGQDIAQTGIGTYWNARQIMLEIWRRKNYNVKNNSWVDVLRDWKTNVMLT